MSDVVVRAEGLAKKYVIGHRTQRERNPTLRDALPRTARRLMRTASDVVRGRQLVSGDEIEDFWALRDVSFELRLGDIMGIVGSNGAGKSTLLKILSRITEPSRGRVEIKGRMASLLEVGTGFHSELTGRENIYLNGAILGMRRAEIRRKFDEIVAFAEVEKFLDTPVKRYSSGMYVRLAFAVAAHLEPEVLIVDEVLAVGDTEFQKKCLGKMKHVAGEGRAVLFVSHHLATLRALCTRALLLADGRVVSDGSVDSIIKRYASAGRSAYSVSFAANEARPSISAIVVDQTALVDRNLIVDISFTSPRHLHTAAGGILLRTDTGELVWSTNSRLHPCAVSIKAVANGVLRCEARELPIRPGQYHLSAWLADWHEDLDVKDNALTIHVGESDGNLLGLSASALGHVDWPASWSSVREEDASAA